MNLGYLTRTRIAQGCLYKHPAGPITQFDHILFSNLDMSLLSNLKADTPFLRKLETDVPVHTGKEIQFFTYALPPEKTA